MTAHPTRGMTRIQSRIAVFEIPTQLQTTTMEEAIKKIREKYCDLVWFARTASPTGEARAKYQRILNMYPSEIKALSDSQLSDWQHGFHSGMLAAVRLFAPYALPDDFVQTWPAEDSDDEDWVQTKQDLIAQAAEEFPFLAT